MPNSNASVSTSDLSDALTYLEGLVLLARRLQVANGVGRVIANELADALHEMDSDDPRCFDPLRYESAAGGMGWEAVAIDIAGLRERLLAGYADAALRP